jgi:hypothetical protein
MDQNQCSPTHQRIAWNKGKLIGAKPPLSPKQFRQSEPSCRSKVSFAISQCSILQSTASCAAVMSSDSKSRTLRQMDAPSSQ